MKNKKPKISSRMAESITTQGDGNEYPTIQSCWDANDNNKKIFRKYLKCEKLSRYHDLPGRYGCANFDEATINFSRKHKLPSMFLTQFYSVIPPVDRTKPRYWLDRIVGSQGSKQRTLQEIAEVSTYTIQKIPELRLLEKGRFVPRNYRSMPLGFELEQLFNDNTATRSRRIPVSNKTLYEMMMSIKKCAEDRIHFRKTCVRQCSTKIQDAKNVYGEYVHDVIIEMLNVLYCKIFMEMAIRKSES